MLGYGVMAAFGNVWGGRLADRKGADFAVMIVLTELITVLLPPSCSVRYIGGETAGRNCLGVTPVALRIRRLSAVVST